jgi:hypothetical protein
MEDIEIAVMRAHQYAKPCAATEHAFKDMCSGTRAEIVSWAEGHKFIQRFHVTMVGDDRVALRVDWNDRAVPPPADSDGVSAGSQPFYDGTGVMILE